MAAEDFRQRLQAETERRVAAIREQQEGSYEKLAQLHEEHGQAIRDRQLDEWVAGVMGPLRAQLDEQARDEFAKKEPRLMEEVLRDRDLLQVQLLSEVISRLLIHFDDAVQAASFHEAEDDLIVAQVVDLVDDVLEQRARERLY